MIYARSTWGGGQVRAKRRPVEDDEQVLDMAIESLEELHYKVVVARSAREALDRLKGPGRIDILFSDVVSRGE
jgi:CheY-like chemotaxis protein